MTELLEKAIAEVLKLSDREQDMIAAIILEELESERKWNESFARSEELLAKLAEKALKDYEEGKTVPLDPDTL